MAHDPSMVKIEKESFSDGMVSSSDGRHFPFGTSLRLENELIEELDVSALAVGDVVEVRGFAFVERKSESEDEDGSEKSVGLQMTFIKIKRETADAAEQLYGPSA